MQIYAFLFFSPAILQIYFLKVYVYRVQKSVILYDPLTEAAFLTQKVKVPKTLEIQNKCIFFVSMDWDIISKVLP